MLVKQEGPGVVPAAIGLSLQALGSIAGRHVSESTGLQWACILLALIGTAMLIVGLSRHAAAKGWNARLGYLGLLSWIGALVVLLLPMRESPDAESGQSVSRQEENRRPFQFGILSLLLAMVAVAILSQYVAVIWMSLTKDDVALSKLKPLIVQVKRRGHPVYEISLSDKTTNDDLKHVAALTLLHRIESNSTHISDEGLSHLAGLSFTAQS